MVKDNKLHKMLINFMSFRLARIQIKVTANKQDNLAICKFLINKQDNLAICKSLILKASVFGICCDLRFPEMAIIAALQCAMAKIDPSAFNMTTDPLHVYPCNVVGTFATC
jgi:hypothetical protein